MKKEFKIGDKVRRLREKHSGMSPGDVGIIVDIQQDGSLNIEEYGGMDYSHDESNFELVEEKTIKKNKWSLDIKGSNSLIKAFAEEIKKLGYVIQESDNINLSRSLTSYNDNSHKIPSFVSRRTLNDFGCTESSYFQKLFLPKDWFKALELAAEVEEEVPEYVEIIVNYNVFKKGEILKTEKYSDSTWRFVWPDGTGQIYNKVYDSYFKPSTKEAYEAQFKIKPEVGKWYKLPHHPKSIFYCNSVNKKGNVYGFGFDIDGNWRESLIDDGISCMCNDSAFSYAVLATEEEVEEALINEAKKRYSLPCSIKYLDSGNGKLLGYSLNYRINIDTLYASENVDIVYQAGKWAEILPSEVKVNGYVVVKINDSTVKVGCKTFKVFALNELCNFIHNYGGTYNIDGKEWDAINIGKVIDEFNKM
jgi:hypothetical protein